MIGAAKMRFVSGEIETPEQPITINLFPTMEPSNPAIGDYWYDNDIPKWWDGNEWSPA